MFAQAAEPLDSTRAQRIAKLLNDGSYADALYQLKELKQHFSGKEPSYRYVKLLLDVGAIFSEKGDYEPSQQYLFEALALASAHGMEELECDAMLEIGYVYYFLEQLDKGIEFADKALVKAKAIQYKIAEGTAHNLKGILYAKRKDYFKAMEEYSKALSIRKAVNNARGIASTMSNIALLYEYENNYNKALELQLKSLVIDDSIQNKYGAAWSKQMIGELLIKMNRTEEALQYLNDAENEAISLDAREILLQVFKSKGQLYSKRKKLQEALHYSEAYNALRDSIYDSGLAGKVMLLQQSYEMNERDKTILLQEAAISAQRKLFWVLVPGSGLLSLLFFFYFRAYKNTRKLNYEIAERNEEIHAQSEELTEANQALNVLNTEIALQKKELEKRSEELNERNQIILELNNKLTFDIEIKKNELYKTNEELVKHNNELLQFSFTVSHNLRGPVARMLGLMNLINVSKDAEESTYLINLLQKATIELDVILKDLNLIIDSRNNLYKVREKIYFEEEWKKCLYLLNEYLKPDYSIEADFNMAPFVFSVRAMLQSILYNLVSNAIKYRSLERDLQVRIRSFRDGNAIAIEIQDNGLGIDLANQHENIFKLYKRFHTHVTGKGLGLYLVKTQLDSLGGSIQVKSQLNVGTTFTITLPDAENLDAQVFFENDAARLDYDATINTTIVTWGRQITASEYREVFDAVVKTLETYKTPGWIADLRKQGTVDAAEQQWFMRSVLPQAHACGLVRIAAIALNDPIREDYYKKMKARTDELGIDLQVFNEMAEAKEWMAKFMIVR